MASRCPDDQDRAVSGGRDRAGGGGSRRRRDGQLRDQTIRFAVTGGELAEIDEAAGRAGLARGAYAARATLAAARGEGPPGNDGMREVLEELVRDAGLVRRIGVSLNQAVARLNATGQHAGDLPAYAAEAARPADRLDETAELVRRALR